MTISGSTVRPNNLTKLCTQTPPSISLSIRTYDHTVGSSSNIHFTCPFSIMDANILYTPDCCSVPFYGVSVPRSSLVNLDTIVL
jgi:hypothetical protein